MTVFTCPVCGAPLGESGRTLVCPARHSFDIAREGYVNLLASRGLKQPKHPGDSKAMLLARRAFLDRGHYQPLSDAINAVAECYFGRGQEAEAIADIGAGEGWYIGQLSNHLRDRGIAGGCYGVDISKEAMRMAAKRYPDVSFAVADVWDRLPFGKASLRALLNIFAPRNAVEFDRVLAPGGHAVIVIPAEDHLAELREELPLIGIEPDKERQVIRQMERFLKLKDRRTVRFSMELAKDDVFNMVMMTPSARHTAAEDIERLWEMTSALGINASMIVLVFEKSR